MIALACLFFFVFLSFFNKLFDFLTAFMADFTVEFFPMGFRGFFSAHPSCLFNGHFTLLFIFRQ